MRRDIETIHDGEEKDAKFLNTPYKVMVNTEYGPRRNKMMLIFE